MRCGRALAGFALGGMLCALSVSAANAETTASLRVVLRPGHFGAGAAVTLVAKLAVGNEGLGQAELPPPATKAVFRFPGPVRVNPRGAPVCSASRLRERGTRGCPEGSLVGRGHAIADLHPASETISEETTLWAFRVANRAGHPAIAILSQGYTPLYQQALITGVLLDDPPPYSQRLALSIPPIPTLHNEPNASLAVIALTLGPDVALSRCAGTLRFEVDFALADGSVADATANTRCP